MYLIKELKKKRDAYTPRNLPLVTPAGVEPAIGP